MKQREKKKTKTKTIGPRSKNSISMIQMHAEKAEKSEKILKKNGERPPRQFDGEIVVGSDAPGRNQNSPSI